MHNQISSSARRVSGRSKSYFLSLCVFLGLSASAAFAGSARPSVNVDVLQNSADEIVLSYSFGSFHTLEVEIEGKTYSIIKLGRESQIMAVGAPDLPDVSRSIIIPDAAGMAVKVIDGEYHELTDIDLAPSKGSFSRQIDPADVPYVFGPEYEIDADYPGELATLGEPYIFRDYRGAAVRVNPFQYNPVRRTLRVYSSMIVRITPNGDNFANVLKRTRDQELSLAFHDLYRGHFLNYETGLRYAPMNETGGMLVICHDAWMPNMQPFVNHKNGIGIPTTMVGVSTIGNNWTSIKNYISSLYSGGNLAFVLLVGDAAQVAYPTAVSGYNGAADPKYAQLVGNDTYPEIIIGRFSAGTAAEVDTQVLRTIEYENMPATLQDWFWRGMGIASNQGAGIGDDGQADNVHIGEIRNWLLGHGYTAVDQIYDPSGTAAMVTAGLNAGRGIINYCGHGSASSWSTTGFSSTHVNALVNDNMLPFIVSVACVNGEFEHYPACFAETWMRATHGSEPTGAIGCYMSSINQPWAPPMEAQDEFNLRYIAETYHSYGALCYAGSCSMMDNYPGSGETYGTGPATFNTWILFGDPSLRIVGVAEPPTGLKVAGDDFVSSGQRGGPYTPSQMVYVLENRNETPLEYEVVADVTWVDIANGAGTLPPLGTANVTVTLNAEADILLHGLHSGTISFTNLTDHDGDAQRAVSLNVDDLQARIVFPLDTDPGWSREGQWAFGVPQGAGSYGGDPTAGNTGSNVFGYNLAGNYANNMPEYYLTTTSLDCSSYAMTQLRFWRWLGVERYDRASVEVSNDGANWTQLWVNPSTASIADATWIKMTLDISAVADGQPTVYIRWKMGPTDNSVVYPGWNIDDVEIWGVLNQIQLLGDLDGNGVVDLQDLATLLAHYGMTSGATYEQGDLDGDGDVDLADLATLLAHYGDTL